MPELDLQEVFDNVPMFKRKRRRFLYGDLNEYFLVFADDQQRSFILSWNELYKSDFHFARLVDKESTEVMLKEKGLTNLPMPLEYPSDIVVAFTRNTAAICRPVPISMTINQWADRICKNQ